MTLSRVEGRTPKRGHSNHADRRCANAIRVAKVLVLADQGDKIPTPVAKQNVYTPEMERIARQGLSDYLKSHGMDDQTIESIAVK